MEDSNTIIYHRITEIDEISDISDDIVNFDLSRNNIKILEI